MNQDDDFLPRMRPDFFRRFYDRGDAPGTAEAGAVRRQESHREREIMMVLAGQTGFLLDGGLYQAAPGDVFFMDHWVPHQAAYENIKSDFCHIWFHFHEKSLFAVPHRAAGSEPRTGVRSWDFSEAALAFLQERWDRLAAEPRDSGVRQEILASLVRLLCEEFANLMRRRNADEEKGNPVLPWLKNYISMRYGRDCQLCELERITGYNRFHLMRLFKEEYGMTIGEYINCVRRGFAAAAAGRKMRQKEIAEQLGFQSAAAYYLWRKRDRERNQVP